MPTNIEWSEETLNAVTGCERVSPGCDNCYATTLVNTRQVYNPKSARFGHPFHEVMLHEDRLDRPRRWTRPRRIFMNSLSDLWHRDVPDEHLDRTFAMMEETPRHTFQVLTKRSERMMRYINARYPDAPVPAHIWIGVSLETGDYGWRVEHLRRANISVRFISAEPLIGSIRNVSLEKIAWLICGGESGAGARPMDLDWAREARDMCAAGGTAFFLKQLGGVRDKRGKDAAVLDGRRWTEYPVIAGEALSNHG
jgi:protein gp37